MEDPQEKLESIPEGMKLVKHLCMEGCYRLVPDNVYGRPLDEVRIPDGYRKAGFREPEINEVYIGSTKAYKFVRTSKLELSSCSDRRRIIIEPAPKRKVLVIEVEKPKNITDLYPWEVRVDVAWNNCVKVLSVRAEERDPL